MAHAARTVVVMAHNITDQTTDTAIHELYIAQINRLITDGREDLITDLTADYDQQVRSARRERRAA